MNLDKKIRKLARSPYWQQLYESSKTCHGIKLFDNDSNFSYPQYQLLYWLKVYNMLYDELYELKWPNLDEEVIRNDDRCDSFLYYRRKKQEKELRDYQKENRKNRNKSTGQQFKVFSGPKNKLKEGENSGN